MGQRSRVAVLISGRGSNMASLLEAAARPDYPAEIALVVSNRPDAGGLKRAAQAGVPTAVVDHKGKGSRQVFEEELDARLREAGIEIVCLAGFMRLLTPWFVNRWNDRLINIHPALLPSFKGLDTHARALAEGCRIHGATVHFVRAEMDAGPIIVQGAIPVLDGDDEAALAARVLAVEHRIYPQALALVASGRVRVDGMRVFLDGEVSEATAEALISPQA
ncbi:phosphoribosylglycinamide formyltransferase [Stappia sp. F7233]|uniref:Phosphoribosylglycinamide formyltransferase n=1 Tax=Stappia albiluteola TaxID=2758565 RepID=A0A839ACU5_9HYPH|nr:phosphoribosylglycinamide formyltransferase [Stappia albiluteola]MBA5776687.1 phosphoribosylglycinamide formyltransferase [Stappia albiluteola]